MSNRLGWLKVGSATAVVAVATTWLLALLCGVSNSWACNDLGVFSDVLNAPARFTIEPILRKIAASLGVRRLGPDFVAAPPGATTALHILSWFSFFAYWFIVGAGVYLISRFFRHSRLHNREATAPSNETRP